MGGPPFGPWLRGAQTWAGRRSSPRAGATPEVGRVLCARPAAVGGAGSGAGLDASSHERAVVWGFRRLNAHARVKLSREGRLVSQLVKGSLQLRS